MIVYSNSICRTGSSHQRVGRRKSIVFIYSAIARFVSYTVASTAATTQPSMSSTSPFLFTAPHTASL